MANSEAQVFDRFVSGNAEFADSKEGCDSKVVASRGPKVKQHL
jgi:hypothetical protein